MHHGHRCLLMLVFIYPLGSIPFIHQLKWQIFIKLLSYNDICIKIIQNITPDSTCYYASYVPFVRLEQRFLTAWYREIAEVASRLTSTMVPCIFGPKTCVFSIHLLTIFTWGLTFVWARFCRIRAIRQFFWFIIANYKIWYLYYYDVTIFQGAKLI